MYMRNRRMTIMITIRTIGDPRGSKLKLRFRTWQNAAIVKLFLVLQPLEEYKREESMKNRVSYFSTRHRLCLTLIERGL